MRNAPPMLSHKIFYIVLKTCIFRYSDVISVKRACFSHGIIDKIVFVHGNHPRFSNFGDWMTSSAWTKPMPKSAVTVSPYKKENIS